MASPRWWLDRLFVGRSVVALWSASTVWCNLLSSPSPHGIKCFLRNIRRGRGASSLRLVSGPKDSWWFGVQTSCCVTMYGRSFIRRNSSTWATQPCRNRRTFQCCTTAVIASGRSEVAYLALPFLILLLCIPLWKVLASNVFLRCFSADSGTPISTPRLCGFRRFPEVTWWGSRSFRTARGFLCSPQPTTLDPGRPSACRSPILASLLTPALGPFTLA